MKIGFFELEGWEKKLLKKEFSKDKLMFSGGLLKAVKDLEVVSVFVNSKVDGKLLDKMPNLKLIVTRSTGFNHIDLGECRERGIVVCNVPVYGTCTVAEHAFALILGLTRKLVENVKKISKVNRMDLRGSDLCGKTLGVVGTGNIGQNAARIGRGFQMKVLAFDIYKNQKLAKEIGYRYVGLENLFKESDVITLHLPYNKHTHHLVDGRLLGMMKKNALLINTARGEIVDTFALVSVLKSGKIAGAGLDVLEGEKIVFNTGKSVLGKKVISAARNLVKLPNVLVTPHNAFNTQEALDRILATTIKNIKSFKKGRKVNVVK